MTAVIAAAAIAAAAAAATLSAPAPVIAAKHYIFLPRPVCPPEHR